MAGETLSPGGFAAVAAMSADSLDPGPVEPVQACTVKDIKPKAKDESPKDPKKTFIEIVLVDKTGKPVPFHQYRVTTATGDVREGLLDEKGFARVDGIDPGSCKVTFPDLDGRAWRKK